MNDLGWGFMGKPEKEAILQGIRDGVAYGGPFHIEVHPTDRCNTNCFFCSTRWRRGEKKEIPFETWKSLVEQMKKAGTRSVLLSGGGEPLAHTRAAEWIEELMEAGIPLDNLTTNGIGLTERITRALVEGRCGQVIVSLNCSDEASYARMMRTDVKVFHHVIGNIRRLVSGRGMFSYSPKLILQFLVYKENYRTIPDMYRLARTLKADGILYNGLSYLGDTLRMTPEETETMMRLFEEILLEDEYRTILGIHSYEQGLAEHIERIEDRMGLERGRRTLLGRGFSLLTMPGYSFRQKWDHHWMMKRRHEVRQLLIARPEPCIRPWYTLVVRSDGQVPICCVRQAHLMADVATDALKAIWEGEQFVQYRKQMRRGLIEGGNYKPREGEKLISEACTTLEWGTRRCPFRSFYYRFDLRFYRRLLELIETLGKEKTVGDRPSAIS
jgi:MoaA/NifB/PqqE/SkfB family radical SAM enzyme